MCLLRGESISVIETREVPHLYKPEFRLYAAAIDQIPKLRWSESPCNQSGRKGKGLWKKGFAEEPGLEFRMKY